MQFVSQGADRIQSLLCVHDAFFRFASLIANARFLILSFT